MPPSSYHAVMGQQILIDGYNLLYALGLPHGPRRPRALEKARNRLLDQLAARLGKDVDSVTVVFDARHPPPGQPAEENRHGVHVVFAVQHGEADDLLEDLIRRHSSPRQLSVVSDDHRIQRAARRRRCRVLSCGEFLDELKAKRPRRPSGAEESIAPKELPPASDNERWIKEFADLDQGPEMRELFGWLDFEEPEDD